MGEDRHRGTDRWERATAARLGELSPLLGLDVDALVEIARLGCEVRRRRGAVLHRAGQGTRQVLLVLEGSVVHEPDDARGSAVSAGPLIGGSGRPDASANVIAGSEVRLLVFGPADIPRLEGLLASGGPRPVRPGAAERRRARVRAGLPRRAVAVPSVA